jgi:hypothetical protein
MSKQLSLFDVPNPCVGVCQSDNKGYCLGCKRTRDERIHWLEYDANEKQKVIKRCLQRKKRAEQKEMLDSSSATKSIDQSPTTLLTVVQPSLFDPPIQRTTRIDDDLDFSDFEL